MYKQQSVFFMNSDEFHGELFIPESDKYSGKAIICFTGSDSKFKLAKLLAEVFQSRGLTALALAYVKEEGLPKSFFNVPVDPVEKAAEYLHELGYEKVGLWGISKGAELALLAGSLLPKTINAVIAVSPISTVCQGFKVDKGVFIMPGSSWTFHGKEVPYSSFALKKFPVGEIFRESLRSREINMTNLYLPLVETPVPDSVIPVEKITGPILLISSKMDKMWPSSLAASKIMNRLEIHNFSYPYKNLSYNYGGHMFVPIELRTAKFFRGDRGKNRNPGRKARMDSLEKTLDFISKW